MFHFRPLQLVIVFALITGSIPAITPNPASSKQGDTSLSVKNTGGPASFTQAGTMSTLMPGIALAQGITAITASHYHTCALTNVGGVKCWGGNDWGQLGDGTTTDRLTPVDVSGLASGVMAIAAADYHTCALMDAVHGGGAKCWGNNASGELGDGTTTDRLTPVNVSGLANGVTAIAAGGGHTCALTSVGGVKCWGWNYSGQLGDGTTTNRLAPVNVSGLASGVMAIAAGKNHTCALTLGGSVKCWGWNIAGQLGDGTMTDRLTPIDVGELASGVAAIAAGFGHTCVLISGGSVKCWGYNLAGQLGDGTTTDRLTPVDVDGLANGVTVIAAGMDHTCALMDGDQGSGVKCWGGNYYGQLGDGTRMNRLTPVDVSGLASGVTSVVAGLRHTCALMDARYGGGVKCWGDNNYGELGDGTSVRQVTPVRVSGLTGGAIAIVAGWSHSCALTNVGGVKCWGDNSGSQLGDGTTTQRLTPVDVNGLTSTVTAITAGGSHTCALTSADGVKCWGVNYFGQLGDGTTMQRLIPVDVSGLTSGVIAIAADWDHTCALMDAAHGGSVKCWGFNGYGQLGDGTTTNRLVPVDVNGLTSGVTAIAAGGSHTCALTNAGGVKCWGFNGSGQLGDGTTTQRLTPVDVSGLTSTVTAIAAGGSRTCALTSAGGVKCWGYNDDGGVGDGTHTNRLTPVNVSGLTSGVAVIAAGGEHTCILMDVIYGGGVKCWGANFDGQLGDGTKIERPTPIDVGELIGRVTDITAGGYHTCALIDAVQGGSVKCWGFNRSGQLGDGNPIYRTAPVDVVGLGAYFISGQVRDSRNAPVAGVTISTTLGTALTDASGTYTVTNLSSGAYTIAPVGGYIFLPASRTINVPPDAIGQDFVAYTVFKEVTPNTVSAVNFGDVFTYTLNLITPNSSTFILSDHVPTYTSYISGSLVAPAGIAYDSLSNAISGTLDLTASVPSTVSFTVRVEITGTVDFAPLITNRACVYPEGSVLADCLWSNEVWKFTYVWPTYLPAILRND